jgi:predicted dehydrogenase
MCCDRKKPAVLKISEPTRAKRMKIGVYGSGSIGKRHIANIKAIDPDAETFTFARGEPLKNCDAVIVATPSSLHMRILEEAIAQAIPCYIEKPVVTERADVSKLELLSVSMPTLVGCNLRYLGSLRRLRDMLKTGAIGRPVRAIIEAGQWLPTGARPPTTGNPTARRSA